VTGDGRTGWWRPAGRVLRFTWRDLTERPDEVVRTVVSLLAERVS
jgi:hypothetical protein